MTRLSACAAANRIDELEAENEVLRAQRDDLRSEAAQQFDRIAKLEGDNDDRRPAHPAA